MNRYRLVWGANLENEMQCGVSPICSDPEQGEWMDDENMLHTHDVLKDDKSEEAIPYVLFQLVETKNGNSWNDIDSNDKGYELLKPEHFLAD